MSPNRPNILYLHSHDAGQYIEPYGHNIPTPNLQRLAEEGTLFRHAFCAAPTCSPSRAALLTGQSPHEAGMLGLAHRGWGLRDYDRHIIHTLRTGGYRSTLCGVQHIADSTAQKAREKIGYDRVLEPAPNGSHDNRHVTHDRGVAQRVARWLSDEAAAQAPFFLSVGFLLPHREYLNAEPDTHPAEDTRFVRPPAPLPDVPQVREDMANFIASARVMDECCGTVLRSLEQSGLSDDTLVIATTDHGIAFPLIKCNLTDGGLGVYLIIRGPGGFDGGQCIDGMVSHLDIYPTLCELLDIARPHWLEGTSLLPLVRGETSEIHEALFGEVTYHAAYEPQRSIRTKRWKYIRRFDPEWTKPVMPNCDDGPSKRYLMEHGWRERTVPSEQLYDLVYDANESNNLAYSPAHEDARRGLANGLREWMEQTDDPLLQGPVPLVEGGIMNPVDEERPDDETAGRQKFSEPHRRR